MSTETLERDATSPQAWAAIEECINAVVDSAKITAHCAKSLAKNNSETEHFCHHCAEVCDYYAEECEKSVYVKGSLFAEACRHCAKECRDMARLLGSA